jgi:hypothetical protein
MSAFHFSRSERLHGIDERKHGKSTMEFGFPAPSSTPGECPKYICLSVFELPFDGLGGGSRALGEQLIHAMEVNRIEPVIEKGFAFDQAPGAFRLQAPANFLSKIAITA